MENGEKGDGKGDGEREQRKERKEGGREGGKLYRLVGNEEIKLLLFLDSVMFHI